MSNLAKRVWLTLGSNFFNDNRTLNSSNWSLELHCLCKLEQIVTKTLVGHCCSEPSMGFGGSFHQNECRSFWPLLVPKHSLCRFSPVAPTLPEGIPQRKSRSILAGHLFDGNSALWLGDDLISSGSWYRFPSSRLPSLHSDLSHPCCDFSERRTHL